MKQQYRFYALYLLLLIVCLTGCSIDNASPSTRTIANISEELLDSNIFPEDRIVDVKVSMDEADFQAILDNPTAEQYYEASVNYNGHLLEHIGFRTKGNSSLRSVAGMSDSERYSFKLSFDEYVTQSIGGITKINLNNEFSDASYIREYIAYEIAEDMGIPTPKYSFVRVYINEELWGLYTAVEQLGPAFLEREFGSSSGTLYKSNGGNGAELTALGSFSEYTGLDVKSGKTDEKALLTMTDTLNNGDAADYGKVLDMESVIRFIAFNTVTANMDSYAGNFKHNYYLYEQDGQFSIIPWDLNMAFGGFGGSGILIDEPTGVALASRPLIDKIISNESYREKYHQLIQTMIDTYFTDGQFEARVLELQSLISDDVQNDPTAFVTFDQFQQGIQSLIEFANTQAESIQKQLNGEIAAAGDGSGSVSSGPGAGGMGGGMFMDRGRGNRGNGAMRMPRSSGGQSTSPSQQGSEESAQTLEQEVLPANAGSAQLLSSSDQIISIVPAQMPRSGNRQAVDVQQNQTQQGGSGDAQMPEGLEPPNWGDGAMPEGMSPPSFGDGAMPEGMTPPSFGDGAMPEGLEPPNWGDGAMPNFGGGQFPQGGGFPGNSNSNIITISVEEQQKHLTATLISIGLLALGSVIVLFWRRKSL